MSEVPPDLVAVVKRVSEGESPSTTVRTLLGWFGKQRRGSWINARIRDALEKNKITTKPNFEDIWVDASVQFVPLQTPSTSASSSSVSAGGDTQTGGISSTGSASTQPRGAGSGGPSTNDDQSNRASAVEPNVKVGHLEAANRKIISITRDEKIIDAMTKMMLHNYSQLPVMPDERRVSGMVSWRSIGEASALGKQPQFVRDALDPNVRVMKLSDSFHGLAEAIVQYDAVLVQDGENKISGIITAEDITLHFKKLSEPFLLIGEIERVLRKLLGEKLDAAELKLGKDPGDPARSVEDADDLSFGEAIRLMENPNIWPKLSLTVEKRVLISRLNEVKELRNDVMHFDPDGLNGDSLNTLRRTSSFLQRLVS